MKRLAQTLAFAAWTSIACAAPPSTMPVEPSTPSIAVGSDLRGAWLGAISIGAQRIRLGLVIGGGDESALTARLRQIDPKVTERPVATIEVIRDELRFSLDKPRASYTGKLGADGTRLEGVWRQRGVDYPLTFERVKSLPGAARPQEPVPPLPYDAEEVTIASVGDTRLAGTLTRPRGEGLAPSVLLLSGSGAQDRDESAFGHRPFLVLADALTRRGFAVLRLDDRGVGGSTGDVYQTTLDALAEDATAAVRFLAGREGLDPKRITVIGHSEGGLVAAIASTRTPHISRIALLATPAIGVRELRSMQTASIGKTLGASEPVVKAIQAFNRDAFDAASADVTPDALQQALTAAGRRLTDAIPAEERPHCEALVRELVATASGYSTPWFRSLLSIDPPTVFRAVQCPALFVFGERDMQVDAEANRRAVSVIAGESPSRSTSVAVLPSVNHMLQTAGSGSIEEYAMLEETIAPAVLERLVEWIKGSDSVD